MSFFENLFQVIPQSFILIIFGFVVGFFLILIIWYIAKSSYSKKFENKEILNRKLLLIKVSKISGKKEEEIRDSRELAILFAGVMEQLFSSLHSIYQNNWKSKTFGQPYLSFEIATVGGEICFYISCSEDLVNLVEKQVHAQYPNAAIEVIPYYNPFKKGQKITGASLNLMDESTFPIKTYQNLEADSLAAITNALSKLGDNSTAIIQLIIKPKDKKWRKGCEEKIKKIQQNNEGKKGAGTQALGLLKELGETAAAKEKTPQDGQKNEPQKPLTPIQEAQIKGLQEKSAKVIFDVQLKVLSAAENNDSAEAQLNNILSTFAQFTDPELNGFKKVGFKNKGKFITDFIFRRFGSKKTSFVLNSQELATIFHFPNKNVETPNICWLSAKDAPSPANLSSKGTLLGESIYRGERKQVKIKTDDRRRHMYAIGKTGTGKTTLFINMALSDIKRGKGVCYIDPHGDAIADILPKIPKERAEDVILFNPADTERPMGLNLLEAKTAEQKDFLVQEAIQIFYKLFDPTNIGIIGPQWEHWMRNASLTLMADPKGGSLIDIPRLFIDKDFMQSKLRHVTDPEIKNFWEKQIKQTADFHKSEMLNYFTSKFGRFMTNEMMKNIIGQKKSGFDFRDVMDKQKILLINLSKGMIGEVNSNLLGMICVARLQTAAMSRADIPEDQRKDFYLYVDEFQNFATENFSQILSEARKYRLSLNITNQYVAQLDEKIRDSVFGNVGTLISFRIGAADAEFITKEFAPVFDQDDLINVDKFHAYIKLLIDSVASKPFSLQTIKNQDAFNLKIGRAIQQLSRLKFGRPKHDVLSELAEQSQVISQIQK